MCDESHRPTHRHYQHVPQPQVHHPPDDACQRPQDTKDLHGLHQTLLRGDSRRNCRHVEERERYVVNCVLTPKKWTHGHFFGVIIYNARLNHSTIAANPK